LYKIIQNKIKVIVKKDKLWFKKSVYCTVESRRRT